MKTIKPIKPNLHNIKVLIFKKPNKYIPFKMINTWSESCEWIKKNLTKAEYDDYQITSVTGLERIFYQIFFKNNSIKPITTTMAKKFWSKPFSNIIWRLNFVKVKVSEHDAIMCIGRCENCDGKNPSAQCSKFYCPCEYDEQLKFKKNGK